MNNQGKSIHRLSGHQDVQPDKTGFLVSAEMVVQRGISPRSRFHPVVKIENDLVQRELVGNENAVPRDVFESLLHSAFFFGQLENRPDILVVGENHRRDHGLFEFGDLSRFGQLGRIVNLEHFPFGGRNPVAHARSRRDQRKIELAFQAFLHDLHVQQAQKAAPEAETEGAGCVRFVEKGGIVQLQL